jgi:uncharacterized membrane protein YcaP (DUF421 family)
MHWPDLLRPEIPLLEKVLRAFIVYVFLVVAFRLVKRELGAVTPFDFIILLTISNVLQNAMIGKDDSLTGGLVGALTLFAANGLLARLTLVSPRFERFISGEPTPLVENGQIREDHLRREMMTRADLDRALRKHELDPQVDLPSVRHAYLEEDGTVTVLPTRRS